MDEPNVTMVAFYGKSKPEALKELLVDVAGVVAANLPSSISWAFKSYRFPQIHATIIGMEVDVIQSNCHGHWFKENRQVNKLVDIGRLHNILKKLVQKRRDPLFTIRFGGFPKSPHCECKTMHPKALDDWLCASSQSGTSVFHSCDRTPYDGSFYTYTPGPVVITGWPIEGTDEFEIFPHNLYDFRQSLDEAGFSDKYHYHEDHECGHWKDDDCFIKIGTFSHPLGPEQHAALEAAVRDYLSKRKPVAVDITVDDVSIVLYDDPSLEENCLRERVCLQDFLNNPKLVKQLYDKVLKQRVGKQVAAPGRKGSSQGTKGVRGN